MYIVTRINMDNDKISRKDLSQELNISEVSLRVFVRKHLPYLVLKKFTRKDFIK